MEHCFVHGIRYDDIGDRSKTIAICGLSPSFSDGIRRIWPECPVATLNRGISYLLDEDLRELFNF